MPSKKASQEAQGEIQGSMQASSMVYAPEECKSNASEMKQRALKKRTLIDEEAWEDFYNKKRAYQESCLYNVSIS